LTEPFGQNYWCAVNARAQTMEAPQFAEDNTKRRQIVEGARSVFLAQGFDGASMKDIARAAGVSTGTLYFYFTSKEQLFAAIVQSECMTHTETVFNLDPADHDVEAVLTRLGTTLAGGRCRPEKASAFRTVMAIAERMPEMGRTFYETGPANGIARLASYLRAQNEAGVLAVEDCEVAATQFLDACQSTLFLPMLLNFREPPGCKQIDHVVRIAVQTFMAAYCVPSHRVRSRPSK
jgi:AcrR family transcriptional regulator